MTGPCTMTTTLDTRTRYDDNDDGSVYNDNDTGTRWNKGRGCEQVTRRCERGRNTRPMAYADNDNDTQDAYHDTYDTHGGHDDDTEYTTDDAYHDTQDAYRDTYDTHGGHDDDTYDTYETHGGHDDNTHNTEYATDVRHPRRPQRRR
ncbi:hypothetical protein CVT25_008037 [Psilocybe cyanescens]|uniref:Uncharacterized protein n=1 Tax=Psilocybe cyanescens TaxID=93625 RepID=A0A409XN46_PSICY|nr:hypothetical protein CVT25_008037 [Psilocybe cyanescens]